MKNPGSRALRVVSAFQGGGGVSVKISASEPLHPENRVQKNRAARKMLTMRFMRAAFQLSSSSIFILL